MHYNKEFWFSMLFFFLFIITVVALFRDKVTSYYITGSILFLLFGIAFLRKARQNR